MAVTATFYIPGERLLPQVARLRFQLCPHRLQDREDFEGFRRVALQLEYLPYALGAASYAVFELARVQLAVVSAKASAEKPGSVSELNEGERNLLGYLLDSFLDAVRRAQNGLVPYLRRRFPSTSLPKSLRELAERLQKPVARPIIVLGSRDGHTPGRVPAEGEAEVVIHHAPMRVAFALNGVGSV